MDSNSGMLLTKRAAINRQSSALVAHIQNYTGPGMCRPVNQPTIEIKTPKKDPRKPLEAFPPPGPL
jgi:hypothetical protein